MNEEHLIADGLSDGIPLPTWLLRDYLQGLLAQLGIAPRSHWDRVSAQHGAYVGHGYGPRQLPDHWKCVARWYVTAG